MTARDPRLPWGLPAIRVLTEIFEIFGEDERLATTILNKDGTKNAEEALLEVYRKLRPGEPPTIESAQKHLVTGLLFDERRYDLSQRRTL